MKGNSGWYISVSATGLIIEVCSLCSRNCKKANVAGEEWEGVIGVMAGEVAERHSKQHPGLWEDVGFHSKFGRKPKLEDFEHGNDMCFTF